MRPEPQLLPFSGITIIGLGPGGPELLTRQAWEILDNSTEIYLRTCRHPAVAGLPSRLQIHSFDPIYETADTFETVYQQIVAEILSLGRRAQGVLYGTPGHPFIAEATAPEIVRLARQENIQVRVVEGLSFLGPTMTALGIDLFPQCALIDALELAASHVPSFPPSMPALIAQLYSQAVASEVKLSLLAHYPDEHPVRLIHAAGTPEQLVEDIPLYQIDRSQHIGLLSSLYVLPLGKDTSFEAFLEVIAHLRAPDGCPWDREQDHMSLRSYLLEETYETLSALDKGDTLAMQEEFGDLLLQIFLHAQIASESGDFNMTDILKTVNNKIVRRHPHVFGELRIEDATGVLANWERLKADERSENGQNQTGLLDGVALALPALSQASEYLKRVARVGFDWPDIQAVRRKLDEELEEVVTAGDLRARNREIGDLFFADSNLARWYGVDPESALREANQRFRSRFAFIEKIAYEQQRAVSEMSLEEMLELWEMAKGELE